VNIRVRKCNSQKPAGKGNPAPTIVNVVTPKNVPQE